MPGTQRLTAVVLLGGLVYLGVPAPAGAQRLWPLGVGKPATRALPGPLGPIENTAVGTVDGFVRNNKGEPVPGVVVTAIGVTTVFAVTDEQGHYALTGLPPGAYVVRAHSSGYLAAKSRSVSVRAHVRTALSFAIRRADAPPVMMAAGIGPVGLPAVPTTGTAASDDSDDGDAEDEGANSLPSDDHSDTAWRLRHLRRGVLRDVEYAGDLFDDSDEPQTVAVMLGRAVSSPARAASSFFADAPISGQVNFLTTNIFDDPNQAMAGQRVARGIAYVKVGAPVGDQADWTVRGALTEGALAAWIVAGNYETRPGVARPRDIGLSYSAQRYGGGNPLALREMTDTSRNAGSIYAFDTLPLSSLLTVAYGARYERYDYLDQHNLFSPRAEVTLRPLRATRVAVALSSRAEAPGAQEFRPPSDEGIWLPPQRTFSSARAGQPLRAERTTHASASLERDLGRTTVALRAFGQHVNDQMVTVFGADIPGFPSATLGHYVVGTAGDVDARGGSLSVRTDLGPRFRGSVTYSNAIARIVPTAAGVNYLLLLAPSALRSAAERIHDVTTAIEAQVPETATRVLVFYRVGNGFARAGRGEDARIDSRFDLQLRQALPFLNFTSARWEMLIAIRNSFREVTADQSIYDELLTVQAPKRVIGGVTLHF